MGLVPFEAAGYCIWVMSEYICLLFHGGGVVSNGLTLNCWMVLSGKTSLLYLHLCIEWMGKPSVTGFLLT